MTHHRTQGPTASINVTPLVDIALVLLIIFMLVTPLMTVGYDAKIASCDEGPVDGPMPRTLVVVNLTASGQVTVDRQPTTMAAMPELLSARVRPGQVVQLVADDAVPYAIALQAMDAIASVGATTGVHLGGRSE